MERKAIALLSGGLDSTLAVKLLIDQEIEITAVNFTSPFCNCTSRKAGCVHQARRVAEEFGIPIRVISKGMDYFRLVRNPRHGYGRGLNPCIDCRIYMLRKVREMMPELGSFVVTGEVLGQRPMSQHRRAIELIERESGLPGLILRPLSAHLFPPTLPEQDGVVDRAKLLALSGRSRKPQIELASRYGVRDYPCPAGGCLLTDETIAGRLQDVFLHQEEFGAADIHLLKIGRHFRLNRHAKIVVGRDRRENEQIRAFFAAGSVFLRPSGFRGPVGLLLGEADPETEQRAGELLAGFSGEDRKSYCFFREEYGNPPERFCVDQRLAAEERTAMQIVLQRRLK